MENDERVSLNDVFEFNNACELPDLTNKSGNEIMTAMWGIKPTVAKEIKNISHVYSSKHGMFATIPIICKGVECKYKDTCMVSIGQRIVGQRCPMEIATILSRFEQWCMHFDIDVSQDRINPKDLVDVTLIKDLVNVEVQILRAENKIALNGDFMAETLLDIDKKCKPYFGEVVSPEANWLITLQTRKDKILNQLNATRKDKSNAKNKDTATDTALKIYKQVKELEKLDKNNVDISEIDFDDNGNIVIDEEPHEPIIEVETLIGVDGENNVNEKEDN